MRQNRKWICAVAGSGLVVGMMNYFQNGKGWVQALWTTNFTPSVKWDSTWDKREPAELTKSDRMSKMVPIASRHLILVRHGQYDFKAVNEIDRHLTALGCNQSEVTGLRLKELNFPYTRIIQSTLTRAKETAAIIHKYLPHLPLDSCSLLCEGVPFPPEPPVDYWKYETKKFHEDGARIEAAFKKYFHRADPSQKCDSYEIFVYHANVIRYFVCRALQFPPESWLRFSLFNCSLTWIAIRPNGNVVVFNVGDCGHFPPEMITKRSMHLL